MKLDAEDLAKITTLTLAHYEESAQSFEEGTRDHDVSQNIAALLRHIKGEPPCDILDLGCGPGRDLKTFTALGHRAVGLDGTPASSPWPAPPAAARSGTRTSCACTCPPPASTASSPTPSCSTFPRRNCPASCVTCAPPSNPAASCSAPTPRRQPGRLEPRPLRRLPRPGWLAHPAASRGLRRTRTLLPPRRPAPRTTTLARQCVEKGGLTARRDTRFTFRAPHLWNGQHLYTSHPVAEDGYASITGAQRIRPPQTPGRQTWPPARPSWQP